MSNAEYESADTVGLAENTLSDKVNTEESANSTVVQTALTSTEDVKPKKRGRKPKAEASNPVQFPADNMTQEHSRRRRTDDDLRSREQEERERILVDHRVLQSAMLSGRIMYGVITQIEQFKVGGNTEVCFGVMLSENMKVLIPFAEMFIENPINMDTVDTSTETGLRQLERRKVAFARKMLNVEIPFLITHISSEEDSVVTGANLIVASRSAALRRLQQSNFASRSGDVPRMSEGDLVSGTVLSVASHGLLINVGGVDTRVPLYDATYEYSTNLQEKYQSGDPIDVAITEVKDNANGTYAIQCRGTVAELEKAKRRQNLLPAGAHTVVRISRITKNAKTGAPLIFAWHEAHKLPLVLRDLPASSFGNPPQAGDTATVIVRAHYDNGMIMADCERVHSSIGTRRYYIPR